MMVYRFLLACVFIFSTPLFAQGVSLDEIKVQIDSIAEESLEFESFLVKINELTGVIKSNSELKDSFDVSDQNKRLEELIIKVVKINYVKSLPNFIDDLIRLSDSLKQLYPTASPLLYKINKIKSDYNSVSSCLEKKNYPDCIWEVAISTENLEEDKALLSNLLVNELGKKKIDSLVYLLLSVIENDFFKLNEVPAHCTDLSKSENLEFVLEKELADTQLTKRILYLKKALTNESKCNALVDKVYPKYAVEICKEEKFSSCLSSLKFLESFPARLESSSLVKKALIFSASDSEQKIIAKKLISEEFLASLTVSEKFRLLFKGLLPAKVYYVLVFLLIAIGILGIGLYFTPSFDFKSSKTKSSSKKNVAPSKFEEEVLSEFENRGYLQMSDKLDEYTMLLNVFGLNEDSSNGEIKKAYRELVKQLHPDSSDSASQKEFERVQSAYDRIMELRQGWFGLGKE